MVEVAARTGTVLPEQPVGRVVEEVVPGVPKEPRKEPDPVGREALVAGSKMLRFELRLRVSRLRLRLRRIRLPFRRLLAGLTRRTKHFL